MYYLHDNLGNVRVTCSIPCVEGTQVPTLMHAADYYAYGSILRQHIYDRQEKYLTTHHERDLETGLDYRGARYYDADVARFVSLDPLAADYASWSPYNYVMGNPVSLIDPTGRSASPVYDPTGEFLGTDDEGLQGEAIVMDKANFSQGMSHDWAKSFDKGVGSLGPEAKARYEGTQASLPSRPDWDGFVTPIEGIEWAKQRPGIMNADGTPNSMYNATDALYVDVAQLDFGNLKMKDLNSIGQSTWVNLYPHTEMGRPASIFTTYAFGKTTMTLLNSDGYVVMPNGPQNTFDWNYGGAGGWKRDLGIGLERARNGLNSSHGFPLKTYGVGRLKHYLFEGR